MLFLLFGTLFLIGLFMIGYGIREQRNTKDG